MRLFLMLILLGLPAFAEGFQPVRLPDGTLFETWEQPCVYSQTYHVAQQHRNASDDNPGTKALPFRTINHAAQVLRPGERVIVAAGTYRERVRPARGGTGPDKMISYEAAPGATVIVTGSRMPRSNWTVLDTKEPESPPRVYTTTLPAELLAEDNPFSHANLTNEQIDFARFQTYLSEDTLWVKT